MDDRGASVGLPLRQHLEYHVRFERAVANIVGRDTDGLFRAVISVDDPGVPNWLDTAGRYKGVVQGRWYQASSAPTPRLKRVKLAELRDHLPADTPRIDHEARRESLRARFRGAQWRRKW